jgi:hypothetical protein
VFVVWKGTVTAETWFRYIPRLVTHRAWSATPNLLADLLSVEDTSSIRNEDMAHAVELLTANAKDLRGRRLAVLAQDEFGKARYFGTLLARFGISLVVFNHLDTACLFLGLDTNYAFRNLHEMRHEVEKG